ncbi:MAG: hypothetical protein WBM50_21780 [Acidimicrobiales bacterium]
MLIVFPITAIWHVGLFNDTYLEMGYFNEDESVLAGLVGFVNIVVQGFALGLLYPRTRFIGAPIVRGLKFAGFVFVFYYSVQVVNFVVRKEITDLPQFLLLEAAYMLVQFGMYGALIGVLHGTGDGEKARR